MAFAYNSNPDQMCFAMNAYMRSIVTEGALSKRWSSPARDSNSHSIPLAARALTTSSDWMIGTLSSILA